MNRSVRRWLGTIVAGAVAAVGPSTSAAATTPDEEFDAIGFLTELFDRVSDDPRRVESLREQTVKGSPADHYVVYLAGFERALRDNLPGGFPPFSVVAARGGLNVCANRECVFYSEFVVSDGLLESFSLNEVPVVDRFVAPSKETFVEPVTVRVVGGFQRVTAEQLVVVIDVVADADGEFAFGTAEYVDPDGATIPIDVTASAFPERLAAGQHAYAELQFPVAAFDGELRFSFLPDDSTDVIGVAVPVGQLVWTTDRLRDAP